MAPAGAALRFEFARDGDDAGVMEDERRPTECGPAFEPPVEARECRGSGTRGLPLQTVPFARTGI